MLLAASCFLVSLRFLFSAISVQQLASHLQLTAYGPPSSYDLGQMARQPAIPEWPPRGCDPERRVGTNAGRGGRGLETTQ